MSTTDEALKIWNALRPMVDREIKEKTRSCVRAKKMTVIYNPNLPDEEDEETPADDTESSSPLSRSPILRDRTSDETESDPEGEAEEEETPELPYITLGVAETYGDTVTIPAGTGFKNIQPGKPVWAYWYYDNASTLHVISNGDGTPGNADLEALKAAIAESASEIRIEMGDNITNVYNNIEENVTSLRADMDGVEYRLYSYVEFTSSSLETQFSEEVTSLRSYLEITASHLELQYVEVSNSLRSYLEMTASHFELYFEDTANSLRSYLEFTASHFLTVFEDEANSLRSYLEMTASHFELFFEDSANSLRSYLEMTAEHLQIQFEDNANSLRSYLELTASHLQLQFENDVDSLRSYLELTASHLEAVFEDNANSLRSYLELTASHLELSFEDNANSLRSYLELTASNLKLQFENDAASLRSYLEITASHFETVFEDNANSLRSYFEITASHLETLFEDNANSLRSYFEITASHLWADFENESASLRSYFELTASHLETVFEDQSSSLRSYLELTASHLETVFEDNANSLRSYFEITASELVSYFEDETASIHSSIQQNADKISLVVTSSGGTNYVNVASIVAGINSQSGSYVAIQADKIDLTGYVTTSDLTANYLSSIIADIAQLSTGNIYCDGVNVGNSQAGISANGTAWFTTLDSAAMSFDGDNYFMDCIVSASVSNNVLTLTYASGATATFSKAVSLSGGWNGTTAAGKWYTVEAEQNGAVVGTIYSPSVDQVYPSTTRTWDQDNKGFSVDMSVDDEDGETLLTDNLHFDTTPSYTAGENSVDFTNQTSGWVNGYYDVYLTNSKTTSIAMPSTASWTGDYNTLGGYTVTCTSGGKTYTHVFNI